MTKISHLDSYMPEANRLRLLASHPTTEPVNGSAMVQAAEHIELLAYALDANESLGSTMDEIAARRPMAHPGAIGAAAAWAVFILLLHSGIVSPGIREATDDNLWIVFGLSFFFGLFAGIGARIIFSITNPWLLRRDKKKQQKREK
jgi:hypothetical protein